MIRTENLGPGYDFAQNFLQPLVGAQAERLEELAADATFDPSDYHRVYSDSRLGGQCKVCKVTGAPRGVCGYCRTRVRVLRAAAAAKGAT